MPLLTFVNSRRPALSQEWNRNIAISLVPPNVPNPPLATPASFNKIHGSFIVQQIPRSRSLYPAHMEWVVPATPTIPCQDLSTYAECIGLLPSSKPHYLSNVTAKNGQMRTNDYNLACSLFQGGSADRLLSVSRRRSFRAAGFLPKTTPCQWLAGSIAIRNARSLSQTVRRCLAIKYQARYAPHNVGRMRPTSNRSDPPQTSQIA